MYASPHTSYRWREERLIEPIKCMLSPHTSYRWRGERVIETIKCMLVVKMAPRMAAVLRAPGKLCSFSYVLFVFFVVVRVRCC